MKFAKISAGQYQSGPWTIVRTHVWELRHEGTKVMGYTSLAAAKAGAAEYAARVTLTITPVGTTERRVTTHASRADAEAALAAFAGTAYRVTEHTLTVQTGRVAQAAYTHAIRSL